MGDLAGDVAGAGEPDFVEPDLVEPADVDPLELVRPDVVPTVGWIAPAPAPAECRAADPDCAGGGLAAGAASADGTAGFSVVTLATVGVWCSVLATSMAPPPKTAQAATSTPAAGISATGPREVPTGSSGTGNPVRVNGSARTATSTQAAMASAAGSVTRFSS